MTTPEEHQLARATIALNANEIVDRATPEQLRNAVVRMALALELYSKYLPFDGFIKNLTPGQIADSYVNVRILVEEITRPRSHGRPVYVEEEMSKMPWPYPPKPDLTGE